MRYIHIISTIALILLLCIAGYAAIQIGALVSAARSLVGDLRRDEPILVQAAKTSLGASQTHLDAELQETRKATADIHDLVIHTDVNLNGKHGNGGILGGVNDVLIPRVVDVLGHTDTAVDGIARAAGDLSRSGDISLGKIDPLLEALTARVNDPRYDSILANADASMGYIRDTSKEVDGSATDIHAFVHRETAPVRGTWNVIKAFLRDFAGPAAQVGTAIK